jgi:acetyl-CoA decarbonylase/synthase complex subunit delta
LVIQHFYKNHSQRRLSSMPVIEIPTEKWNGKVREITLGAAVADGGTRAKTVTVGGETTLPFLHFEGETPRSPVIAVEIRDRPPTDWSPVLLEAWGDVTEDVVTWTKAAEESGADIILLQFSLHQDLNAEYARQTLRRVLEAVAVAEEGEGENLVLGVCEDKNYRTIVAAALGHGHIVDSRTPMDVNLAKQLIILIHDMGLPLERIVMDPTTGALGYGIEYGYSVMERLRLAALQGDSMTQQPMLVTPGEEAWRTKEARTDEGVPETWGNWAERAINWETLTASTLLESGADIVALRHPESVKRVQTMINALMKN